MDEISTREKTRLAYSEKSDEYDDHRLKDSRGQLLSMHDLKLFKSMLTLVPENIRILEIGAGTGRFTIPLLERGGEVVATDINEEMLRRLRSKVNDMGYGSQCDIRIEDAFELSFGDKEFELVLSFHFVPRLLSESDQEAALREISRVLTPGGYLFFNFRNSLSPYRLLYKGHSISTPSILKILKKNGLSIVEMKGKHLLTRKLIDVTPNWVRKFLAIFDATLWRFLPSRAWDVFVLAKKD